jgi:hypothetical protein
VTLRLRTGGRSEVDQSRRMMSVDAPTTCENRQMRTIVRRALGLGVAAAAGYALWQAFERRSANSVPLGEMAWEPQPFPFPPQPKVDTTPWIDASESGACPAHHPVKAKLASGIFHIPGGANYARTQADRCYLSADAAAADGLRAAKR